ncbi:uncharacterized protein BCR38DRAFT_479177 [Pseudomassariella vexata]|uniref:Uncharacterized protein n=1 Tax=Pseudomassariella vexata TaxID=1141098 RepID=A0A1Y2D7N6_9PEZI|nr:uncharacterized protein BCR38DRAFT_479177 [Pseudomassariella vexata]ORY55281.1 hypothetical protein BCR38DRAFT_479177 [Pseudomassariella vexata]
MTSSTDLQLLQRAIEQSQPVNQAYNTNHANIVNSARVRPFSIPRRPVPVKAGGAAEQPTSFSAVSSRNAQSDAPSAGQDYDGNLPIPTPRLPEPVAASQPKQHSQETYIHPTPIPTTCTMAPAPLTENTTIPEGSSKSPESQNALPTLPGFDSPKAVQTFPPPPPLSPRPAYQSSERTLQSRSVPHPLTSGIPPNPGPIFSNIPSSPAYSMAWNHLPTAPSSSSTLRTDRLLKYLNKETAKKAYNSSKEFLAKTNEKLEKVINPLMPVLAMINPNIATIYQVQQQLSQSQQSQQNGSGIDSLAAMLSVQAAAALAGQYSGGLGDFGVMTTALNQPNISSLYSGEKNQNFPFDSTFLQDQQGIVAGDILSSLTATGLFQPSMSQECFTPPYQDILSAYTQQQQNSATEMFLSALRTGGVSDQSTNQEAISAYIQQQADASTANLMSTMSGSEGIGQSSPSQSNLDMITGFIQQQTDASTENLMSILNSTGSPGMQYMSFILQQQQLQQQTQPDAQPSLTTPFTSPPSANSVPPQNTCQPISGQQEEQAQAEAQTPIPSNPPPSTSSPLQFQSQSQPPTLPNPKTWPHHRARIFGLEHILLPPRHTNLRTPHPHLIIGDLAHLYGGGSFEIRLLYTTSQIQTAVEAIGDLTTDDCRTVLVPACVMEFGIPTGGVNVGCVVCANQTGGEDEAEEGGGRGGADKGALVMYRAIVSSPYGHGVAVSLYVPVKHIAVASKVAATMLSSIRWIDRSVLCKSVSSQLMGTWRSYSHMSLNGGHDSVAEMKELCFMADGQYTYDRACQAIGDDRRNGGSESGSNHISGSFELYDYEKGTVHLVLAKTDKDSVEVRAVELRGNVMVINAKEYFRV